MKPLPTNRISGHPKYDEPNNQIESESSRENQRQHQREVNEELRKYSVLRDIERAR